MAAREGRFTALTQHWLRAGVVVLLAAAVGGCAALGGGLPVAGLPALEHAGRTVTVDDVAEQVHTPELLATDAAMREFVQRYTEGIVHPRQRLLALHRAVRGQATLGIRYDPLAEGTAKQAFHRTTANCLSYATLFVALAREAGLRADYQWLTVRPQWTRQGERVLVRMHVNTAVSVGRGDSFMVDIDPVPTGNITGTRSLSDEDAAALYHSNIAMQALAALQVEDAWLHSVRALQLGPALPYLWVNLGAVYRYAGQHAAAERSYLRALELDPGNHSAMNNLVVLYRMDGRDTALAHWEERVASYRDANPYFHAWRGDQAAQSGDWRSARDHYRRALELAPEDSRLLHALGLAHAELDEPALASVYLRSAIEHAVLRSDIDNYAAQLRALQEGRALRPVSAATDS